MRFVQRKAGVSILAVVAMLWFAGCNPTAILEEKRLANRCSATYGFNTPDSLACQGQGQALGASQQLAMRDH